MVPAMFSAEGTSNIPPKPSKVFFPAAAIGPDRPRHVQPVLVLVTPFLAIPGSQVASCLIQTTLPWPHLRDQGFEMGSSALCFNLLFSFSFLSLFKGELCLQAAKGFGQRCEATLLQYQNSVGFQAVGSECWRLPPPSPTFRALSRVLRQTVAEAEDIPAEWKLQVLGLPFLV